MNGLKYFERAGQIAVLENSEIIKVLISIRASFTLEIKLSLPFLAAIPYSSCARTKSSTKTALEFFSPQAVKPKQHVTASSAVSNRVKNFFIH